MAAVFRLAFKVFSTQELYMHFVLPLLDESLTIKSVYLTLVFDESQIRNL